MKGVYLTKNNMKSKIVELVLVKQESNNLFNSYIIYFLFYLSKDFNLFGTDIRW